MKKHIINKFGIFTLTLILALIMIGCGSGDKTKTNDSSGGSEGQDVITLDFGHPAAQDFPFDVAAKGFAEKVEKETDGRVKVNVYEAGALGSERDMIEQVQIGTLDMYGGAAAPLINFVPEIGVIDLPFLFTDYDEVWNSLDGELGNVLKEKIEGNGFKFLGFWDEGFKSITNNRKEIRSLEDLAGLKIRTQENQLLLDTFKAIGTDPTPMDWGEIYTSIQQGVIDGYEGSYTPIVDGKLYEVQDYLTEVRVNYAGAVHLMNKDLFESLDPDIQTVIEEAAAEYTQVQREASIERINEFKETIIENGIEIIEFDEIDIQPFIDSVQEIYDKYGKEYEELINLVERKN